MSESKVVPVDPTDEMIFAGLSIDKELYGDSEMSYMQAVYEEMLDAAPSADQWELIGRIKIAACACRDYGDINHRHNAADVMAEIERIATLLFEAAAALQSAEAEMKDAERYADIRRKTIVKRAAGMAAGGPDMWELPEYEDTGNGLDSSIDAAIAGK